MTYKYFDPTETIRQNLANAEQRIFELRQTPEPAFTEQKIQDQINATQAKIETLEAQLPTSNPIADQAQSDALDQAEYNAHRAKAGQVLEAKLTEAVEANPNAKSINDLDPDTVLEVVAEIRAEAVQSVESKAAASIRAKLEAAAVEAKVESIDDLDPDVVLEVVAQIKSEIATRDEAKSVAVRDESEPKATINEKKPSL